MSKKLIILGLLNLVPHSPINPVTGSVADPFKGFNRRILDEFQEAQDDQFFEHFGSFFSIGRSGRVIERCASSRRIFKKKIVPIAIRVLVQAVQNSNIGVILLIIPDAGDTCT